MFSTCSQDALLYLNPCRFSGTFCSDVQFGLKSTTVNCARKVRWLLCTHAVNTKGSWQCTYHSKSFLALLHHWLCTRFLVLSSKQQSHCIYYTSCQHYSAVNNTDLCTWWITADSQNHDFWHIYSWNKRSIVRQRVSHIDFKKNKAFYGSLTRWSLLHKSKISDLPSFSWVADANKLPHLRIQTGRVLLGSDDTTIPLNFYRNCFGLHSSRNLTMENTHILFPTFNC